MTPLEFALVGAAVAGGIYKGLNAYTAYKHSPRYLSRKETRLAKAADKAQRHHTVVLDALSNGMARHNKHLAHAEKLSGKLAA